MDGRLYFKKEHPNIKNPRFFLFSEKRISTTVKKQNSHIVLVGCFPRMWFLERIVPRNVVYLFNTVAYSYFSNVHLVKDGLFSKKPISSFREEKKRLKKYSFHTFFLNIYSSALSVWRWLTLPFKKGDCSFAKIDFLILRAIENLYKGNELSPEELQLYAVGENMVDMNLPLHRLGVLIKHQVTHWKSFKWMLSFGKNIIEKYKKLADKLYSSRKVIEVNEAKINVIEYERPNLLLMYLLPNEVYLFYKKCDSYYTLMFQPKRGLSRFNVRVPIVLGDKNHIEHWDRFFVAKSTKIPFLEE